MAPEVRSIPTVATTGVSARRMALASEGRTYNYTYDVDIHNPIAEPGTYSMMKMLQRQSALKVASSRTGG